MLFWTELKVGHKVIYEGAPYEITSSEHLKVAMWKGLSKVIMKNLITWNVLSWKTFREVDKFEEADVSTSSYDFLYNSWNEYLFMNIKTYEQVSLTKKVLNWAELYLKEWDKVLLQEFNWEPINIKLDSSVTLEVVDTPPWEKWDTATWWKKPATMTTGLVVQVPLFISIWEKLRIDTRTWEYLGKA